MKSKHADSNKPIPNGLLRELLKVYPRVFQVCIYIVQPDIFNVLHLRLTSLHFSAICF